MKHSFWKYKCINKNIYWFYLFFGFFFNLFHLTKLAFFVYHKLLLCFFHGRFIIKFLKKIKLYKFCEINLTCLKAGFKTIKSFLKNNNNNAIYVVYIIKFQIFFVKVKVECINNVDIYMEVRLFSIVLFILI